LPTASAVVVRERSASAVALPWVGVVRAVETPPGSHVANGARSRVSGTYQLPMVASHLAPSDFAASFCANETLRYVRARRAIRVLVDAQKREDLALEVGELGVEDLDRHVPVEERVMLGQAE